MNHKEAPIKFINRNHNISSIKNDTIIKMVATHPKISIISITLFRCLLGPDSPYKFYTQSKNSFGVGQKRFLDVVFPSFLLIVIKLIDSSYTYTSPFPCYRCYLLPLGITFVTPARIPLDGLISFTSFG
jgi:hypothetical protein